MFDPDQLTTPCGLHPPTLTSEGVRELYVGGVPVISGGEVLVPACQGRPMMDEPA